MGGSREANDLKKVEFLAVKIALYSGAPKPKILRKSFRSRKSCNSFASDSLRYVQINTEVEPNFIWWSSASKMASRGCNGGQN